MLVKHLLGEATLEEEATVKQWLLEADLNREYYSHFKTIWDKSKQLALLSTLDENIAWQKFKQHIETGSTAPKINSRSWYYWLKIAASIVLFLGLTTAVYFWLNTNKATTELIVKSENNILIDTLSDGSIVTLNKASSISYPSAFKGKSRSVKLKGEAFFNVTPNKKKPFIISIEDVEVKVVGTSFNIKNENGNTEIIVETGIVRVTKNGKATELSAGEKLLLSTNNKIAEKEKVSDKLYNYYRSKEFVCDDTPLWKLVQVLNEAYDANIIIGNEALKSKLITTTFNNETLDLVLNIIHLTFDITIVKKEGQIILQ